MEPEINAIAKALWARKLMQIAEKTGNMTDNQYGGRKCRQAQSAVINKVLYYDINRTNMSEAQYDDIDLRSNYDRELVRLVTTEAQVKLGMHKEDAKFMVDFVENQRWYVKTGFGISDECYEYENSTPMYGLGQGIAWSGPGWLLSSDTIAKCKENNCTGMEFKSPMNQDIKVKKSEDYFVDDTSCGCNSKEVNKPTIMHQAQHNSQKHSDYVEVTGGLIAADKSNFYHIKWKFSNGQKVPIDQDDQERLILSQGDGGRREIKRLGNHQEHKTLGCWVNPLGENVQAYKQMYDFVNTWRGRMLHSGLSPKLIRQSYNTELLSQLKYRLSVYMFTENQCEELMKMINPIILHSHFLNKNYPRSLMQANEQYGGLSISHLYDVMGMEKSKFLLMHMRRNDTTAKLFTIAMQNLQLECGTEELFFNLEYADYSNMTTNGWLKNLWEYYDSRAIRVDEDLKVTYKKPREGDKFLMDVLGKYKHEITPTQMEQINTVRQHLGLLTLADVADVRGRRMLQQIKRGKLDCRKTKFDFAPQSPLQAWLKLWRDIACPIFEREISRNPLGQWIAQTHQQWKWMYSSADDVLQNDRKATYMKRANVYVAKELLEQVSNDRYDEVVDVDFSKSGHPYIIGKESCKNMCQNEECHNTEKSIHESDDNVLVEYLRPRHVFEKVLKDNLCVVATDGSNKNDEGALAWCCANEQTGEILVQGRGRVSCAKTDSSSLRPELAALVNVIQFLNSNNNIMGNDCAISIHTDSANAIADMKLSYYPTTKNVFENNIDMKIKLKNLLRKVPFQINLEFVEAHQDRSKPWEELDMPARLNWYVDKYAGGTYEDAKCGNHEAQVKFFPEMRISLSLLFTRPTANCVTQLTSFCNGHKAESQLARYWKIKNEWLGNIEWDGLRKAIKRNRNNNQGMQCKLIHKQWPTMQMMMRNGMSLTSLCPLCGKVNESWDHVFQCNSQIATIERQKQVHHLRLALVKKKIKPILMNRILSAILQWTKQFPVRNQKHSTEEGRALEQALHDQQRLRYENMFCGVVTKYFGDI